MPSPRRELASTKCAICRQPAAQGERLCAPCTAALKRARDSSVSEAITPTRRLRRPSPQEAAVAAPAPVPRSRWIARGVFAAVACAFVIGGGVWIAHTRGIAGTIAPRYAIASQESADETIKAAATAAPAAPAPASTPAGKSAAAPLAATDGAGERTIDVGSLPSSITMPRGNGTNVEAPEALGAFPVVPAPAPAIEAPRPPPVVVTQAPPPPLPDRWQRLADSLARCPPDVIARTMCQETLRIEHCDGFWGRVAACPAKVEREYGN